MSNRRSPSNGNDVHVLNNTFGRRIGYANRAAMYQKHRKPFYGMNAFLHSKELSCKTCVPPKVTKQTANAKVVEVSQRMIVQKDICSRYRQETGKVCNLFWTFTVVGRRYTTVKLLKSRNEVTMHCRGFNP